MALRLFIIWLGMTSAVSAFALVERNLALGLSVGTPQLAALEGTVLMSPHVQLGFSFGLFGLGLAAAPTYTPASQQIALVDGNTYSLTPETTLSFNTLCPFIRIFPGERNFYFQLTAALYRVRADVTSRLEGGVLGTISTNAVAGNITLIQTLPTISIGHIFMSKFFFVNLSLGASFLANTFVSTELATSLPDVVGGNDLNKEPIEQAKAQIQTSLLTAADEFKRQFFIIPSLMLAIGFMP